MIFWKGVSRGSFSIQKFYFIFLGEKMYQIYVGGEGGPFLVEGGPEKILQILEMESNSFNRN